MTVCVMLTSANMMRAASSGLQCVAELVAQHMCSKPNRHTSRSGHGQHKLAGAFVVVVPHSCSQKRQKISRSSWWAPSIVFSVAKARRYCHILSRFTLSVTRTALEDYMSRLHKLVFHSRRLVTHSGMLFSDSDKLVWRIS